MAFASLNISSRNAAHHSHFTKRVGQIFTDLHPKYAMQCVGGDVVSPYPKRSMFSL
jgi:hypothetical protein